MSSPILFALAALIWGSTFWAITLQLGEVAPAVSVVYRFGIASAVLFAWCYARGDKLRLPWPAMRWVLAQGFFSFALSYVCTYNAELFLVSALVAVLFALTVFWNPICSRIAFGTPITWRTWAAGMVAVCGVIMLFFHSIAGAWAQIAGGGTGGFLLGLALALTATISSACGNVVVSKVREQCSNLLLTLAYSMLCGTLMVALFVLATGQQFTLPSSPRYWAGMLYLAVFGSVIAFAAFFTLINRIGAQKAVYIGVLTPVISVLLSIQLEGYRPGLLEFAGMAVCLASVAWAVRNPSSTPKPALNLTTVAEVP